MIPISIFFLVIAASIFHAIWNFFARKVKGNMGVVWIGFFLGDFFVGPVAIYFIVKDIQNQVDLTGGLIWGFWSALALAYKEGDISLVYPIARGSGVAGTALISGIALKEKISLLGWIGISSVVTGIFLLGIRITFSSQI